MKDTIYHALLEAGKILMSSLGRIKEYSVKESQSSIVTKADIDSEMRIIQIISENFASHSTLGEETGFTDNQSPYIWIIDPLDGTSNFAAGIPWFGVIICVLKDFNPIMAGCYLPVTNDFYFAEKGKGATLNGKEIFVSKESNLKNILAAYSLDFSDEPGKTEHEAQIIQRLVTNIRNLRSTNCLIDMCFTAEGKFGACVNQTTKIWDIAAPGLIIEEAGGTISDIFGNKFDYSLNQSNYNRNFTFAGSNQILHQKIINLLNF